MILNERITSPQILRYHSDVRLVDARSALKKDQLAMHTTYCTFNDHLMRDFL